MMNWIQNIDWSVLHWIQLTFRCGFLDFLMPKITLLGDLGAIWIASAIAMVCTKKYRKYGVILLFGLAVSTLFGDVFLKHLVARPRPCWLDTSVPLLIANPTDYSFPSGHTMASFTAATILTKTNHKFGIVAIPLACLISFSRLYLYVHFPTDVLSSVVFGFLIGTIAFIAGEKWLGKSGTSIKI